MNMTKNVLALAATTASLLGISACQVTVPATDSIKPRLAIGVEDGGLKVANSSDSNSLLSQGCPTGTSTTIQAVSAYHSATYQGEFNLTQTDIDTAFYYSAGAKPFTLSVISADDGGTSRVSATFDDRTVDTLMPDGSSGITNITPLTAVKSPNIVPSSYDTLSIILDKAANSAYNVETLRFTINDFVERPILSAFASDFHGNKQSIRAHFFPDSVCQ